MTFKPMLAATVINRTKLRFPFLASPKLDGIRCIVRNGQVLSRSFKPIRNKFIVHHLKSLPDLDGELIVGSSTVGDVFNRTTRGVMSVEGHPSFQYHVFDTLHDLKAPFKDRLAAIPIAEYIAPVLHTEVTSLNDLSLYEDLVLEAGYEGVMLRGPHSAYKCGRATANENSLWKLKQFTDGELVVNEVLEGVVNINHATMDALGRTVRSKHQDGMIPSNQIGTIIGHDIQTGWMLELSPGRMAHAMRIALWQNKSEIVGKIVKYKCFNYGSIDTPRFATFQGFRDPTDMS